MRVKLCLVIDNSEIESLISIHRNAIELLNIPDDDEIHSQLESSEIQIDKGIKTLIQEAYRLGRDIHYEELS